METKLKVTLMEHTPNPERLIAASAKLCYSDCGIDEITENLTDANVEKFLGKLMDMGHTSPIEHVSFTFGIEGISRACSHQLVRHRIASYSQKSQRYVNESWFDYITPPEIEKDFYAKKIFQHTVGATEVAYNNIVDILVINGRTKEEAQQDARFILPNACTTSLVCTMNVRSLLHFFNQRCCNRAQWEIRAMAEEMLKLVKGIAPTLFKNAGAPCVSGWCPEGEMGCKK